jgi:hypothetical protein
MTKIYDIALLEKDEASNFIEYANRESTSKEKELLIQDYEFYKTQCID